MGQINTNTMVGSFGSLQALGNETSVMGKSGGIAKEGFKSKLMAFLSGFAGKTNQQQTVQAQNQKAVANLTRELQSKGFTQLQALNLITNTIDASALDGERKLKGKDIKGVITAAESTAISNDVNAEITRMGENPEFASLGKGHATLSSFLQNAGAISKLSPEGQEALATKLAATFSGASQTHAASLDSINNALQELRSPSFTSNFNEVLTGLTRNKSLNPQQRLDFTQNLESIMLMTRNKLEMQRTALNGQGHLPIPTQPTQEQRTQIDNAFKLFSSSATVTTNTMTETKAGLAEHFRTSPSETFLRVTGGDTMAFNNDMKATTLLSLMPSADSLSGPGKAFNDRVKEEMLKPESGFTLRNGSVPTKASEINKEEVGAFLKTQAREALNPIAVDMFIEAMNQNPAQRNIMQETFRTAYNNFASVITHESQPGFTPEQVQDCKNKLLSALVLASTSPLSIAQRDNTPFYSSLNGVIAQDSPAGERLRNFFLGN